MVPYQGKPIIDHILEVINKCNIKDIVLVSGYREDVLKKHLAHTAVQFYHNERFAQTNMVSTLFCAETEMNDDLIISYADIVYSEKVLQSLIYSPTDFSVVVDKDWRTLWNTRMENPLSDAETMKLDRDSNIIELGKKANSYDEIEGQYIGLIKISCSVLPMVRQFYHSLSREEIYDGKDFDNMYMTSFIQLVINRLLPVKAVSVHGGWVEIDSVEDLATVPV